MAQATELPNGTAQPASDVALENTPDSSALIEWRRAYRDGIPLGPCPNHPKLSEFHFVKALGEGGGGKVFLAVRRVDSHLCAMKVMSKRDCANSGVYDTLRREAQMMSTLDHPFVVKIEAAFQNRNHLFIALEFVRGGTFLNLVREYAPMSPTQAKFYVSQLVLALDYLHGNLIVHGDLKPANLLVTAGGYLKITDFGLATSTSRPPTNTEFGTLFYLAPETITPSHYGPSIDWWALGVLMYEMLYGRLPFDLEDPTHPNFAKIVQRCILAGEYHIPFLTDDRCLEFLHRLLSPNPNRRNLNARTIKEEFVYFQNVDWTSLRKKVYRPPFVPCEARVPLVTANTPDYSSWYEDSEQDSTDSFHGIFDDFYYLRPTWRVFHVHHNASWVFDLAL